MASIALCGLYPENKRLIIDTEVEEARITISGERSLSARFSIPSGHRTPPKESPDFLYNTLVTLAEAKAGEFYNYGNSHPNQNHARPPKGLCSKEFNIGHGASIKIGTEDAESVFLGIRRDGFVSNVTINNPYTLSSMGSKYQNQIALLYDTIVMMLQPR